MAMRTAVGRWLGASQVRTMLRSGRQQQQSRVYATEETYTGRSLDEKEKAAETRYIRQMEEERKLKKAAGEIPGSTPEKVTSADAAVKEGGFRNIAVVAGIVAAVAGYWLLSGSGSSKKEEKEST